MTARANLVPALLCLALAPIGCGDDSSTPEQAGTDGAPETTTDAGSSGSTDPTTGGDSSSGGVDADITYYEHIRPLLTEHCVACHTEGSIAPFRLDSMEDAMSLAPAIKAVVEARTMPPFGVRADGSCQEYDDPWWLTDDEIAMVSQWVDGGMAAGDDTIEAPEPPELPTLDGETELVGIPEYEPETHEELGFALDDYRCFPIELGLDADRYLVGYDVLADNDALVHHVLGFRVDPGFLTNTEAIAALEGSDEKPGWPCYGAAGEGILPQGVPVTWAPGQGAVNYPEGVGVRFSPGDIMVVQMHYNLLDDGGGLDASQIRMKWADQVDKEGFQVLWDPFLFGSFGGGGDTLPPGQESAKYEWAATFEDMYSFDGLDFEAIDILGIIPHMHEHGRKMAVQIEREDAVECAADVDRYDYNWQRTYFYDTEIQVSGNDTMHVQCDFDTRSAEGPISAGFGTQDEMCLVGLFFTEAE